MHTVSRRLPERRPRRDVGKKDERAGAQDGRVRRKTEAEDARTAAWEERRRPGMPGRQLSKKDGGVGSEDGGRPGKTEAREAKIAAVQERRLSGRRDGGRGREKRRRRRKNAGVHAS